MTDLEKKVRKEIGALIDPETGLTFDKMGLIKEVKEEKPGVIRIDFIPTSPFCPIAFKFAVDIKKKAESLKDVKKVFVYCHGHVMEEAINKMVNK